MSSKKCIYKNCTNTGTGGVTLFSFPKDVVRQNAWLELAGRAKHTLQKSDCLCELHFGRQFISSNQRRKVLVGVALPFSFEHIDSEIDEEQQIELEALDDSDKMDMHEMFDEDTEQQVEDVDSFSSNSAIEHVTLEDYAPETTACDTIDSEKSDRKRKLINVQTYSQNGSGQQAKLLKISSSQCKQRNGIGTTKTQQNAKEVKSKPEPIPIIDHPDVSIFNIRGEEFIQMPKTVYLEEKNKLETTHKESYTQEIIQLREELSYYKNIVYSIKNQLKTVT